MNAQSYQHPIPEEKKIKSIQFGLLSPSNIERLAVCEITKSNQLGMDEMPSDNDLNDLRMGPIDKNTKCKTCKCKNYNDCPGHFGYIKLVKPVYHVGFFDQIIKVLKCICWNCHRLLINDYDIYTRLLRIKNPKERQLKVYNLIKNKSKKCKERKKDCDKDEKYNPKEDPYYKKGCNHNQPLFKKENLKIKIDFTNTKIEKDMDSEEENIRYINPEEVLKIFSDISDLDLFLLGFDNTYSHPEWMIIKNLIVCPPQVRPSVIESSLISQDDLTNQYKNILISNENLKQVINNNYYNSKQEFDDLQMNVATLMKNNLSYAKALKKNGEPIKSLFDRLIGKEGRIRQHLMGKRVNFSARSVISPDPNIELNEVGVPLSIAMNLTFPEIITDFNIKRLEKLVENGPTKYPGANRVITDDGKQYFKYTKKIKKGFIIERHMQDGDFVIFNRQPSLHKMSMMGHRVRILPYSTFRLNLSVTTPYNADFDGDEMNLHFPQSLETISEIKNIMHVPYQIVTPQTNKPIMGIVQDALIGCKIFTERDNFLTLDQVNNLLIWIKDFDITKIPMPCIMKPKPLWSGKQIFSLILPKELNIENFREDTPEEFEDKLNLMDNFIQIKNGELLQGIICKQTVGASKDGIVDDIWKRINPRKAKEFLGNCQKIINNFLLIKGWTVGISDMICDPNIKSEISKIIGNMKKDIEKKLNEAQLGELKSQPGKNTIESFEYQANEILNNAENEAGKLVQNSLNPRNHLKNMVSSGSKGNKTNLMQIIAFAGQQNVEGKRIPFNFKNRTLPHFVKDDYRAQSKGFVEHSFIDGLNPQEFFFHAMGGREGIIDTSVKTAQTGYIQRRLIKALEDIMVNYDGTVRNSLGQITQFLYGEDGIAGEFIEDQKFETLLLDNDELEKNYKFHEKNKKYELFDGFNEFLENSVVNELKDEELNHILNELDKEYEQIKQDRDFVRDHILKDLDNSIHIPLNINKIIALSEAKYKINRFHKSNLNPLFVLQKVKELKKNLKSLKGTDPSSFTLFNMVLNYSLSTKNIIFKHRLNKEAFNFICEQIIIQFEKAIVNPGEMVGSLAAQSIGEPTTQMTLNTFHLAGVKSANVTLGVPRLIEILNASKEIKTPSMTIYLKEKKEYSQKEIYKLIREIEYTPLINIVSLSEIYYEPDIRKAITKDDKEFIDNYFEIEWENIKKNQNFISPWLWRFVLDENYFNPDKDIMKDIEDIIRKSFKNGNILIIHSYNQSKQKVFYIRLEGNEKLKEKKQTEHMSFEHIKNFEKSMLNTISIYGIKSIKKVYTNNIKKISFDKNTGKQILIEKSKENGEKEKEIPEETILETDGSNLSELFEFEEIDFKRTISNDINDIFKVLGIEAVRKIILDEIRNVIEPYDIYINYRHISILCDYMTQKGYLTSITRYGLKKGEFGPLRKATFEETIKIFLEAGIFSEKDELKGVSESILLGKLSKLGTGCFDLLLDLDRLKYNIINSGNDNSDINSGYNLNKGQTPFIHHSPEINSSSSPEYNPNNIFYGNPMPYASSANNPSNINQNQNAVLPNNLLNNQFSINDNKNIYSPISPANPFFVGADNNSQNYIQGTGGGIYNISPNLSDNDNTSHYQPISQGIFQTNPNYNITSINNSSPFINKVDENQEEEEEEEEENNEDNEENNE